MKTLKTLAVMALCVISAVACAPTQKKSQTNKSGVSAANFQKEVDGKKVDLYTLRNSNGLEMTVTNFGAKVVSLMVPDKEGKFEDIVLGYDNLDGYLTAKEKYFGAAIGRFGNRIKEGKFTLNGKTYQIPINNGKNSLHGGTKGFNHVVWDANQLSDSVIEFSYLSPDMEMGFPGNLTVKMVYTLTSDNEFKINYTATTDKPTVINLTHHSFFNLHGAGNGSINDHILYINANYFTPTDSGLIPTGEIVPVAGTPMDFTTPTEIGLRVNDDFTPLKLAGGYDHNWVLNQPAPKKMILAASVYEPKSGRFMEVYTDEPGLQFYGGNFLDGSIHGKGGKAYIHRSAIVLESQHFPDSPNNPSFPSTVLNPGETYTQTCIYKFSVK